MRAWHVHYSTTLTLHGAISSERCWEQLSVVPDFSGITQAEFEVLIQHMIQEDYLFMAGVFCRNKRAGVRRRTSWNFMRSSVAHLYKVQTG